MNLCTEKSVNLRIYLFYITVMNELASDFLKFSNRYWHVLFPLPYYYSLYINIYIIAYRCCYFHFVTTSTLLLFYYYPIVYATYDVAYYLLLFVCIITTTPKKALPPRFQKQYIACRIGARCDDFENFKPNIFPTQAVSSAEESDEESISSAQKKSTKPTTVPPGRRTSAEPTHKKRSTSTESSSSTESSASSNAFRSRGALYEDVNDHKHTLLIFI